jgi:hypothetical protein
MHRRPSPLSSHPHSILWVLAVRMAVALAAMLLLALAAMVVASHAAPARHVSLERAYARSSRL